jgi:tripartite ATP-independent transporter DctM subunit
MVVCLLVLGGFLRRERGTSSASAPDFRGAMSAAWAAKWELATPFVAIGSLLSGLATPMESAALTAAYALITQAWVHRELGLRPLAQAFSDCAQIIGGVMLILGMALALTNFMVDAGIPDRAVEWVQSVIPNRYVFLIALCVFLFFAAALMEIYAAIVVLVPLLLPLATAYGIDPVHFGIVFLAAMEVGFLCPPAGMNVYFASAMFKKSIASVARSVLPAMGAIFVGTLLIAMWSPLATALPHWVRSTGA